MFYAGLTIIYSDAGLGSQNSSYDMTFSSADTVSQSLTKAMT